MSTEKEFDYQAYMRNLPLADEDASNRVEIPRGPEARQKRWEAAKARNFQKNITNVAQFHARLEELDSEGRPFLYRGQPESHWPVSCSAVRRLTGHATKPIENQLIGDVLIGYLEYLIDKARRRGFFPADLDESATDLELIALLQHQGAATGLIDFTRQPLAALWFACNEPCDKDGAVYVLPSTEVTEIKDRKGSEKEIVWFYGQNKLWSWEPPVLGNRVVAQSSVFVFGASTIPLIKMERLTISAASKNTILNDLEAIYGINEEELFPDFSGYSVANSSKRIFDAYRSIDYWKEQIDSTSGEKKARAYFSCGVAYRAIQECAKAIEYYDEAIHINPQYAEAFNNRGNAKHELGRNEEAIADYDEAISTNPQFAIAYNNRAAAKGALCRYGDAIEDWNKAIGIDPLYAAAYSNRGMVKYNLDRYQEAIADFDEAIRIDPQFAAAYHSRGVTKNELSRHVEAITDYDEAIRLNAKDAEAYTDRGDAKAALGRYEEAIADYNEAIRINPQYDSAHSGKEEAKNKLRRTSFV